MMTSDAPAVDARMSFIASASIFDLMAAIFGLLRRTMRRYRRSEHRRGFHRSTRLLAR